MHHLVGQITHFVEQYGLIAVFVSIFTETFGIPTAAESALVVTADLAAKGQPTLPGLILAAWAAACLGDNLAYLIGRRLGREMIVKHGTRVGLGEEVYARAETFMARHGGLFVIAARFVYVMRQLNGLVAGATGMRWHRFLIADLIGTGLWVTLWALLGYFIGPDLSRIPAMLHHFAWHISGAVAIGVALIIAAMLLATFRLRSQRRR
ncbi:MAG: DedA family protein [Marinibacterium sp.]|nr:DedA family protein [Marinibacterium sp.]